MADGWAWTRRAAYDLPHLECDYGASDLEFALQKRCEHHHHYQNASLDLQQKQNTRRVMSHRQWKKNPNKVNNLN